MSLFKATRVSKFYAHHKALDEVSLDVPRGAILGLLGPNGAGKTTLMRVITRVIAPDSGELFFKGRPLAPADVNKIGYLPEERGMYKKMKTGEQAIYFARLKGLTRRDATRRLKGWFEKFGIEGWWDKKVEELSKGMAQKVQFIITVLHEPELLIFDEPFSGFDPVNTELLKHEILDLQDKGATIIFSTHNMESVEEVCTRIALIDKARKVIEGPVNEIREAHAGNAYRVTCRNMPLLDLEEVAGSEFTVVSRRVEGDLLDAVLRQDSPCETNALLERVLARAEVISYEKMMPRVRDIFIQLTTPRTRHE